MIIKRNMAIDSLTKVCDESLKLIKELIEADNETYGKGYEDGMAAQAKVQHTLRPWVGLTDEEQLELYKKHSVDGWGVFYDAIEAKLKEKNT
jgi:hypothetical protein